MHKTFTAISLGVATLCCTAFAPPENVVLLLGPPGSGKGTHAAHLGKSLGYPHISMGDLLRQQAKQGSELGAQAKEYMDKGEFPPEELVLQILFERLGQEDCRQGVILDGFPRTLSQAAALRDHLLPTTTVVAFNLSVPDEVIEKRLESRLVCTECGQPYNLISKPPKVENQCDDCQSALEHRPDDIPEVVRRRLQIYHEKTEPLVVFYQREGKLVTIDSKRTPERVFSEMMEIVHTKETYETTSCRSAETASLE